jgi:hypothetical protein
MLALSALIVFIIAILIVVLFTQFVWNYVMPDVFGVKTIEFWQTLALLVLAGIFFGGHCSASNISCINNMST